MTTEDDATNERGGEPDDTGGEQRASAGSEFDPNRLRTLPSMRRDRDDRMIAGVCAGAARYLNIDPIVVRVVVACLAFVGLAGVILYVAGWLLIPKQGENESVLDRHLPESVDREQTRRIGLLVAAAIAAASMLGAGFTFADGTIPVALAALALFYVFAVIPYNSRQRRADAGGPALAVTDTESEFTTDGDPTAQLTDVPVGTRTMPAQPPVRGRDPRRDRGMLLGVTTGVAALVIVAMAIYSETAESIDWPYFPLAALLVVGGGMLVGTFVGNGRPLAILGFPLALIVLLTTLLPTYTVGDERHDPALASDVADSYDLGVGNFVLDLSNVSDPESFDGRTIEVDEGFGSMEIVVPGDLNVDVDAHTDAGSLKILDRSTDGAPVSLRHIDPADSDPVLQLDLDQTAGEIRVTRR